MIGLLNQTEIECGPELACHCGREIIANLVRALIGPGRGDYVDAKNNLIKLWEPRENRFRAEVLAGTAEELELEVTITSEEEQGVLRFLAAAKTTDTHSHRIGQMFAARFQVSERPKAADELFELHSEFHDLTHFSNNRQPVSNDAVQELVKRLDAVLIQLATPSISERIKRVDEILQEANEGSS